MNPYPTAPGAVPASGAAMNYPGNVPNPASLAPNNGVLIQGELNNPATVPNHAPTPASPTPSAEDGNPLTAPGSAGGSKQPKMNAAHLFCQVEDCRAPLEGLKEYHQRYKVCDHHLKMEYIERDGQKLRFCQQCGRFQPLEDFDDRKRSCRARLQRHNARRRKRPRDLDDMSDPTAAAAIAAGFSPTEVSAMQDAMQFASATLMQTTAQGGMAGMQPNGVDMAAASASATIAGLPFGGGLQSMPFVPSRQVMLLLLKGYAGMFHYNIESIHLKPRTEPTPVHDLTAPMEAAAAAAAAAMAATGVGGGVAGDDSAAAHLMAIQSQQGAAGEYGDAAAAAAAAAAAGLGVTLSGVAAGIFPGGGGVFTTDVGGVVNGAGVGQGGGHQQQSGGGGGGGRLEGSLVGVGVGIGGAPPGGGGGGGPAHEHH